MTDEPTIFPDGQLFSLMLVSQDGKLHYKADWKRDFTPAEECELAIGANRILLAMSPDYRTLIESIDEAAKVGFKLMDAPMEIQNLLGKWFN